MVVPRVLPWTWVRPNIHRSPPGVKAFVPMVGDRLHALAHRYGVSYEALVVEVAFVQNRAFVHFATNPRLAASYARRGSEMDHLDLETIWRLQNPNNR